MPAEIPVIKARFSRVEFLIKLPKMLVKATQTPVMINKIAVQNDFFETLTFIDKYNISSIRILPKSKSYIGGEKTSIYAH